METRSKRVTRVLCAAGPRGSAEAVALLLEASGQLDVQAAAIVGDLSGGPDRAADYRALFQALGHAGRPAYWVPGPADAPIEEYLREAQNVEVVFPLVRGVHGTAAFAPDGHIVFAGFGGHVSDDPAEPREELQALRYPRWEPEYRLKVRNELHEHQLVLLLSTPPAHKGLGTAGSEGLAELVNTHRPRLVVCGGERGSEMLGTSLVVAPGSLADGYYAVADLHAKEVELGELAAWAS
jgi:Icc-related predicted phosphoesterase